MCRQVLQSCLYKFLQKCARAGRASGHAVFLGLPASWGVFGRLQRMLDGEAWFLPLRLFAEGIWSFFSAWLVYMNGQLNANIYIRSNLRTYH